MINIQDKEILITTTAIVTPVVVVVIKIFNQNQFDLTLFLDLLDLTQDKSVSLPHSNDSISA